MIEARSSEAVREFLGYMRPRYAPRVHERLAFLLFAGISIFSLFQVASRRFPRVSDDPIALLIVVVCGLAALVTAVVASLLVTASLRHHDERVTFSALPGFFNWSVPDDRIEVVGLAPMAGQFVLKVREKGSMKFRTALVVGEISSDIERFVKAAEPGATDNPDDAQRLREDH